MLAKMADFNNKTLTSNASVVVTTIETAASDRVYLTGTGSSFLRQFAALAGSPTRRGGTTLTRVAAFVGSTFHGSIVRGTGSLWLGTTLRFRISSGAGQTLVAVLALLTGSTATNNGIVVGRTGNTVGHGCTALARVVARRVSQALVVVRTLLFGRTTTHGSNVAGTSGGTRILTTIIAKGVKTRRLGQAIVFVTTRLARATLDRIGGFSRALSCVVGWTFGWSRSALTFRVSSEARNAEIVVGTRLGTTELRVKKLNTRRGLGRLTTVVANVISSSLCQTSVVIAATVIRWTANVRIEPEER